MGKRAIVLVWERELLYWYGKESYCTGTVKRAMIHTTGGAMAMRNRLTGLSMRKEASLVVVAAILQLLNKVLLDSQSPTLG